MRIKFLSAFFVSLLATMPVQAQEWPTLEKLVVPETPALLKPLEEKGAQIRYLGPYQDFDGWVVFDKGRPTFTYATKDNTTYFQGMMFNQKGENLTLKQLQDFRIRDGEDSFDTLNEVSRLIQERERATRATDATKKITDNLQNTTAPTPESAPAVETAEAPAAATAAPVPSPSREPAEAVTKSDKLMQDLQNANWVSFGDVSKPEIYAMIDPACPHCQETMLAFRPYLDQNLIEMRVMPVGFELDTKRVGALMLVAGDAEALYYSYITGKTKDLGKSGNVNTQGIDRNLMTINTWGFDVTPMMFYRNAAGEVKIIRGVPGDIPAILKDING
jgi:protein-disulfide isomerase